MLENRKGWERIILTDDPIPALLWLGMKIVRLLFGSGVVGNT